MAEGLDARSVLSALKTLDDTLQKSLKAVTISESKPTQTKKGDVVNVFIRVVFIKLGEIDTVHKKFQADAFMQAKWRELKLDNKSKGPEDEDELPNPKEYWLPQLYVDNALGEIQESLWYVVTYNENGEAYINERHRFKGTFFEVMELYQYPFDTQDLTVSFSTHLGENEIQLDADPWELSCVTTNVSFVDEQEWSLHTLITSSKKTTTNVYKSSKHKHPAISISCKASRRYTFFIWNIILLMLFICAGCFLTYAVPLTLVQNRLQLSFILMLSMITFKFSVSNAIPKVSYLTYLDTYVIITMSILFTVTVWHAIVFFINTLNTDDPTISELADRISLGLMGGIWIFFNLGFFVWCVYLMKGRSKSVAAKEDLQVTMLKKMEFNLATGNTNRILPKEISSASLIEEA